MVLRFLSQFKRHSCLSKIEGTAPRRTLIYGVAVEARNTAPHNVPEDWATC